MLPSFEPSQKIHQIDFSLYFVEHSEQKPQQCMFGLATYFFHSDELILQSQRQ